MILTSWHIYILIIVITLVTQSAVLGNEFNHEKKIETINVICDFTVDVPSAVRIRITETLQQTLERLLIEKNGESIENYISAKSEIEERIIKGLNIVFEPKGYEVQSLNITFDTVTTAEFNLKPFRKHIGDVKFALNTDAFHPFWSAKLRDIFNDLMPSIRERYLSLLIGLPVDAEDSDWAFDLVKDELESDDLLNKSFHDMKVGITIDQDETTVVSITPSPESDLIKTLRVRAYSRSMFQLVLDPLKEVLNSNSDIVVGMPVSWLIESSGEIEGEFERLVNDDLISRKFSLQNVCNLYFMERDPGAVYLELKTESTQWHLTAEVMVDVGNDETPDEIEGHLGFRMGESVELFTLLNFFPDDIRFRPDVGIGFHLLPGSFLAVGWDIDSGELKGYVQQHLSRDVWIDAEMFNNNAGQDQFGVVYKPYQFVSFGMFSDGDDDYWLRASFAF